MRFNEILLLATLVTGLVWLIDTFFFRPSRVMLVLPGKRARDTQEPWWVEYSRSFFPILLVVLILRCFILEPFRIPSGSMRPTLLEGDFILVNKFAYGLHLPFVDDFEIGTGQPKRGEVVIFKHMKHGESIDMIKRVVGLPGDHVEYKNNVVYINGEPVKKDLLQETNDQEPSQPMPWRVRLEEEVLGNIKHEIYLHTQEAPHQYKYADVVVPEGQYFVMGDNRDNSDDSRFWGFVNKKDIMGRALGIWFSWDSTPKGLECLTKCVRWQRIGNGLGTKINTTVSNPQGPVSG